MRTNPSTAMAIGVAFVAVVAARAPSAAAFCRTTTVSVPASFDPTRTGSCMTEGLPLWWRNACVGYDLQQNGTTRFSFAEATAATDAGFAAWSSTRCSGATGSATSGPVSITAKNLGPVACDAVSYNSNGGNQNVIIFWDADWPHPDAPETLGLTTVTYNSTTGEIYDADMELNMAAGIDLGTDGGLPASGFDFGSVVTHEAGHFYGMAHSNDVHATMYANYVSNSASMRALTSDDLDGICTIYPPSGKRSVSTTVAASGLVAEDACDATPRHGFSTTCTASTTTTTPATATPSGCSVGSTAPAGGRPDPRSGSGLFITVVTAVSVAFRHMRRRSKPGAPC